MSEGWPTRRREAIGIAAAMTAGLGVVVAAVMLTGPPRSDDTSGPIPDDRVVATLGRTARDYPDDLRAALAAARAAPGDAAAAHRAARALIDHGRSTGDSRIVGAALGVLRPRLEATPDAETLVLAATARQYQHDFNGALGLLDQALSREPENAEALLIRATIRIVRGRYDLAEPDCRRLFAARRPALGLLCQSAARTLTAAAPEVYDRLAKIVAEGGFGAGGLRTYALDLMGEIAALQGEPDRARDHFREVLAADPDALRVRMLLADLHLGEDDPAAALDLLSDAPDIDGVLLRRALAAERIGDAALADAAQAELGERFRRNIELGVDAHAREETRFFLEIADQPERALQRALVNWDLQHEIEDVALLIDAAMAANQPGAAGPVLDWMEEQNISVPTLAIPDAVREAAR